jgi:hypothetical protein
MRTHGVWFFVEIITARRADENNRGTIKTTAILAYAVDKTHLKPVRIDPLFMSLMRVGNPTLTPEWDETQWVLMPVLSGQENSASGVSAENQGAFQAKPGTGARAAGVIIGVN